MRKLLYSFLFVSLAAFAETPAPAARALQGPTFVALSVARLEASMDWYTRLFGLATALRIDMPDGSGRIAILRSDSLVVELIEHKTAVAPPPAIAQDRYLERGIFKAGFFVADLDEFLRVLEAQKVTLDTGIVKSQDLGIRFIVFKDNDGNLLQAFQVLK
jgi:catechol 2,3-dioxygenase-like lactoylglutathione lyase family enzyme